MARLMIEKFAEGQLDKKIAVPLFLLHSARRILPAAAIRSLKDKGIDLDALYTASCSGQAYQTVLDVREKHINKTIVISLQP